MAPVLAVVLVIEYVAARLLFRRELTEEADPAHVVPDRPPVPRLPVVTVGAMLVGFAVASPLGVEPFWVSGAAAVVLLAWAARQGRVTLAQAVHAGHPAFAIFVLCLGIVVAALAVGPLGDRVRDLLPHGTSFGALLLIALLATLLANLLTNLSATLLLVPHAGAAGHDRGARGAARAEHRLGTDLHRVAGQPALAPDAGPARPAADDVGVPPRLAAGDAGQPAGSGHGAGAGQPLIGPGH